jgi:predicted MPP superfamily phosphohydrolase
MILFIFALVFLVLVYGIFIEPHELIKTHLNLEFEDLLQPLKIVHISDFHYTRFTRPYRKILKVIKEEQPDIVCITGDFVSDKKKLLAQIFLKSVVNICSNVYAVPGNWDHKVDDFASLVKQIKASGTDLLINESSTFRKVDSTVFIAGADDPYREMDDLEKTFKDIPKDGFVILLAHSPDIVYRSLRYNPKLILAGHLHGGQVALPFFKFALYSPSKYWIKFLRGLYRIQNTYLYVNRGVGESHLRIRICSPPEVMIIDLKPADNL